MRSSITPTPTKSSFTLILSLALGGALGCSVYDPGLIPGADTGTGCPAGTADCDGNGSCESDLTSEATCGSCEMRCSPGERCVAGTMCIEGDAELPDAPPMDATGDANFDGGTDSGIDPCSRQPPGPPGGADGPDVGSRTWALRDVTLDQSGDVWRNLGYDLDNRCTEDITDEHLCIPPEAPVPPLDGDNGIDNAFGESILARITAFNSAFEANARRNMEEGNAILVTMKGWNGTPNDPLVDIEMVQALGVNRADAEPLPQWDGDDRWIQASTSFQAGLPLIRDDGAYVTDGMFVMNIPNRQPITLPWVDDNIFDLLLTDATLTGRISEDGQMLTDVLLTGRYALIDLSVAWEAAGLCAGGMLRTIVDDLLGRELDVRSAPGTGGPGRTCDAISVAMSFTGFIGSLSDIEDPPPPEPVTCQP